MSVGGRGVHESWRCVLGKRKRGGIVGREESVSNSPVPRDGVCLLRADWTSLGKEIASLVRGTVREGVYPSGVVQSTWCRKSFLTLTSTKDLGK